MKRAIEIQRDNISYWNKLLERFKGRDGLKFLEVGSYEGRSAIWLLENILMGKNCELICIDTFEGGQDQKDFGDNVVGIKERFLNNTKFFADRIKILQGYSQVLLRDLPLEYYDFIYIDGSHMADDVLEDAILAFRCLKKNGILLFDDYTWNAYPDPLKCPKAGIDAFVNIFAKKIKILEKYHQFCLQKL